MASKDDCYAATANLVSVRMALAWYKSHRRQHPRLVLYIGDIGGAFLKADTQDGETIIVEPPPEWVPRKLKPAKKRIVWKLRKALYGLRTSPARWQAHFDGILKGMKFTVHPHDSCVYVKKTKEGPMLMVCCWE